VLALAAAASLSACTPRPDGPAPAAAQFFADLGRGDTGAAAQLSDLPTEAHAALNEAWSGLQATHLDAKILGSRYTEDTGFTTRSRRTTYDILLTITNNKRSSERIVLTDALPVARDEKIVVKLLAPAERDFLKPEDAAAETPRAGIARDAEGRLTWCLDLKAGEKRELAMKFSIEHPSSLAVSGVD
jgi:hypothetical protein